MTYRYNNEQLEEGNCFVYEVSIYKLSPNRVECLASKYYKSDKELSLKECKQKKYKGYTIVRYLSLLIAPKSFIEEHNLKIYELQKRKKK
jgi:DNA gyrase/topoisomerase IV subunit B